MQGALLNGAAAMAKAGCALAVLLSMAAGLQQAAAVEVASADEFVAAVKAEAELIEVVDHLFLNTGAAVELAMADKMDPLAIDSSLQREGYLISFNGRRLTIKVCRVGQCLLRVLVDVCISGYVRLRRSK